jgi:putative transposase
LATLSKRTPAFEVIDKTAFAAKNLYNRANYSLRPAFTFEDNYLGLKDVYPLLERTVEYYALPRKVSNRMLLQASND